MKGQDKHVCIIVPVYNAEKYLGYCLNSIVSQTYTNWSAILIDDGSTDTSLQICRQYMALDSRFRVYSKPNGGVSSARNFGLQYAEGDYLEFLDSDDCLAADALEKQIELAKQFDSQLVVMDIMMVDFSAPAEKRVLLSSAWLGKSPCCLNSEEFRANRMQLIWYTVLLECLHSKLYDMALWKKLDLLFPEDMSLGEDFIVNMKYYEACNNVVFLHECGHYYNCIMGSDSLTHRYREDLFEIKMSLIRELETHLGGAEYLSAPEKDAFYCYVASSGLACVEDAILHSEMDHDALAARLNEMLSLPLFAASLQGASYFPERFAACVKPALGRDIERVIRYIADEEFKKSQGGVGINEAEGNFVDPQEGASGAPQLKQNSGIINRMIRKVMRYFAPLLPENSILAERLNRWESEIAQWGLKYTFSMHIRAHKKVTRNMLEKQVLKLEADNSALRSDVAEGINTIYRGIEEKTLSLQWENSTLAMQLQENINGYTWTAEQRTTKYAYLRDINELRQRKKAIMIATAEHANIGDAAITLAEQQFLGEQFSEYYQVEISTYEFSQKEEYLHAILNPGDILFINGGGNIGDQYLEEEQLHQKIIQEFPNNKIVIFPQTICFQALEGPMLKSAVKIYNYHKDLTLFVRGSESFAFAKKYFVNVKTVLMPDMVHLLRSDYAFERKGALLCLRDDAEGQLTGETKVRIDQVVRSNVCEIEWSTNINHEDIGRDIRGMVVRKELMRFASHRVVVTDRLHGMIFSAITGTPCVVLSSYNYKIQEYYEAFFHDSNAVFFIGDDLDKLENALQQALRLTEPYYPVFEKYFHGDMRAFFMQT